MCYFTEIRVITRILYIWKLMLSIYKYACSTTPYLVIGADFEERLDLFLILKFQKQPVRGVPENMCS